MGTLFDYLNWRGDLSFSQAPINEVDSLIFSLLSYLDFDGIVPSDFADEGMIRAIGFTKNENGRYEVNLIGFFDEPCKKNK